MVRLTMAHPLEITRMVMKSLWKWGNVYDNIKLGQVLLSSTPFLGLLGPALYSQG